MPNTITIYTVVTDDKDGHTCEVFSSLEGTNEYIKEWLESKWDAEYLGKIPKDIDEALEKFQQSDPHYFIWAEEHDVPNPTRPSPKEFRVEASDLPTDSEGNPCIFTNHYKCTCDHEWQDQWSCPCDDRCPECDTSISPHRSDEISTVTHTITPALQGNYSETIWDALHAKLDIKCPYTRENWVHIQEAMGFFEKAEKQ